MLATLTLPDDSESRRFEGTGPDFEDLHANNVKAAVTTPPSLPQLFSSIRLFDRSRGGGCLTFFSRKKADKSKLLAPLRCKAGKGNELPMTSPLPLSHSANDSTRHFTPHPVPRRHRALGQRHRPEVTLPHFDRSLWQPKGTTHGH